MGDPSGIGPEVILKALKDEPMTDDILIAGSFDILIKSKERFALDVPLYPVKTIEDIDPSNQGIPVIDLEAIHPDRVFRNTGPTTRIPAPRKSR